MYIPDKIYISLTTLDSFINDLHYRIFTSHKDKHFRMSVISFVSLWTSCRLGYMVCTPLCLAYLQHDVWRVLSCCGRSSISFDVMVCNILGWYCSVFRDIWVVSSFYLFWANLLRIWWENHAVLFVGRCLSFSGINTWDRMAKSRVDV